MQKIGFTFIMALLLACVANAQTEKGRWTVGAQVGNISYRSSGGPYTTRNFTMSLSPSAGYFVAKNVVVGASLPVSYFHYRMLSAPSNSFEANVNSVQAGLAPFVRVYIGSERLRPFIDGSVGYSQQWYSTVNFNGTDRKLTSNAFTYSASAGVAYFINNSLSLDASLGYSRNQQSGGSSVVFYDSNQPGVFNLNIGFRLFLGR